MREGGDAEMMTHEQRGLFAELGALCYRRHVERLPELWADDQLQELILRIEHLELAGTPAEGGKAAESKFFHPAEDNLFCSPASAPEEQEAQPT